MEIQVTLTPEEIKQAVRQYISSQNMKLTVKSVSFDSQGNAIVKCDKDIPYTGFSGRD